MALFTRKPKEEILKVDEILKVHPIFQSMLIGFGFQQLTKIIEKNQKKKSIRMLNIIKKALNYLHSDITFPAFNQKKKMKLINILEKQKKKIIKKLKK
tara:strand:+ start:1009 stop:1302 length:294 start_codon:yes stop_codon:yes gene_type:complete